MFHRNCRCLPCLKSHEIWEVLRCDHLKSSILGYKRSLEKPRITFSKVSSSYSTKIFAIYQTWILQKIYLRTEHSYPWPTWNPSTSGSPVPNSCKTARIPKPSHPHPGFSQRTATCPSGPNLCTERWRWRSASSNSSPTPETLSARRGVGMDSVRWTVVIVRWTRMVLGGGWWYFTEKSPGQISSCAEVSGYIYIYTLHTILNSILLSYQFSLSLLLWNQSTKTTMKNFGHHFPIFLNSPSPIFLSKKVPHLVVNLLFSTWC